ncbi:Vba1p NDAI_0H02200 [Naumovozyma dairenensis CBS 421]|uniref:Major facilitator superfamily (MFS) profile domain-containing protein n=1 Tax=Naumovozyma dairenensis (strain ATCC 10597 / BCRC 20456 / CBS 421 / NBRC 0211 / NRRL Y-12639) TaxID=1071378 RepID=G0WF33_NAUDC|nr:hypothetical protein NDAI_0H02200 [Naumovozyma dairenensis CBS 421]CCD26394.1 hypothetical protein NDAI_0H02200 [Naumovozyma dairenensis CBS 421]
MDPLDETSSLLPARSTIEEVPEGEYEISLEKKYHEHNLSLPKVPILSSLWLGSFFSSLDSTIVANIMNRVAEEFAESDKKQWIATSFLLTNTAFQPLYGKLSDITGRKFAVLTAHFFFGLGCLLTCFAQNVTQFSIARAICGMGAGGINAMSSITTSDICTTRERGIFQGYANIVFGMGQVLGAPLGGLFLDHIGWRTLFGIQVPMIMFCSYLTITNVNIKLLHVPPRKERFTWKNLSRIDIFGSLSLVATISGILFLTSTQLDKLLLSLFTFISFGLFMWIELYYAKERILPFDLLNGSFGLCSVVTVISSYVVFGDIFRSPIYLQLIQDISVTKTGLFLIIPSIAMAGGSLVTGWILRNTTKNLSHCAYGIILSGVIIQLAGLVIAYLLIGHLNPSLNQLGNVFNIAMENFTSGSRTWKVIFVFSLLLGSYGYSSILVATLVSIVFTIEKSQQGTMTGIFYLWRSIGNVLGASLTLVLYRNTLAKRLWIYMFETENKPDSYIFTKDQYYNLIRDSGCLRRVNFPIETLKSLLNIYRGSFLISYIPNIALSVLGIMVACVLLRKYANAHA